MSSVINSRFSTSPRLGVPASPRHLSSPSPRPPSGLSLRVEDRVSASPRQFVSIGLGLCLFLALGCTQVSRPEQAQVGEHVNPDLFLHEHLQQQSMVTVGEAYRAAIMLADGDDRFNSFASREEYLLSKKIIRPEWKLQRDKAIDRGSVAYMVMQILKVRGGVNANVYGRLLGIADRRYAVRELVYIGIMRDKPPYQFLSGAELVDVIGNADAYMAENGLYPEEHTDVVKEVGAR